MKTAREVAWRFLADSGLVFIPADYERLTAVIEQVQRETVEAAERAIGKLPVVGIATAPYIAALVAARRAVLALSPKGGQGRG